MLRITIVHISGNQKVVNSDVQPGVKDDVAYVQYPGENNGGLIVPLRNVRYIEAVPVKEKKDHDGN